MSKCQINLKSKRIKFNYYYLNVFQSDHCCNFHLQSFGLYFSVSLFGIILIQRENEADNQLHVGTERPPGHLNHCSWNNYCSRLYIHICTFILDQFIHTKLIIIFLSQQIHLFPYLKLLMLIIQHKFVYKTWIPCFHLL